MRESEISGAIKTGLKAMGYVVLSTASYHSKIGRKTGISVGVPDLLVSHDNWPNGSWLGLEIKNAKGILGPEQEALEKAGRIVIARSWDDAIAAVRRFEGTEL